jgi:transposase
MPDLAEPPAAVKKRDLAGLRSRRLKAAELFEQGAMPASVAATLGVSVQSAARWRQRWEQHGSAALGRRVKQGRPMRISRRTFEELGQIIARTAPGFSSLRRFRWTPRVLQDFILRHYGVAYHLSHCWRLLRRLSKYVHRKYPPPREPAAPIWVDHSDDLPF